MTWLVPTSHYLSCHSGLLLGKDTGPWFLHPLLTECSLSPHPFPLCLSSSPISLSSSPLPSHPPTSLSSPLSYPPVKSFSSFISQLRCRVPQEATFRTMTCVPHLHHRTFVSCSELMSICHYFIYLLTSILPASAGECAQPTYSHNVAASQGAGV